MACVGIKDTTCTLEGIQAKIDAAPESIIYQANTPYLLDAVDLGARGTMAITSTAAADISVKFWEAMPDQREDAVAYHRQLVLLDAILRFGYPATAKYLAQLRGHALRDDLSGSIGAQSRKAPRPCRFGGICMDVDYLTICKRIHDPNAVIDGR